MSARTDSAADDPAGHPDDNPQGDRDGRAGTVEGDQGIPAEFVDVPTNEPGSQREIPPADES